MLDNRQQSIGVFHAFENIISPENLLAAWEEFVKGKRKKKDVQAFNRDLMTNILELYEDLKSGRYQHGGYHAFKISDPKPRDIHKASVQDRLMHHAIYRKLYPFFDRTWIADSYSCRNNKGTHRAMLRFQKFGRQMSVNRKRTAWILKCDIRKFFASIDHEILFSIVSKRISDSRTMALIKTIVQSFTSTGPGKGLPLGNLTSQLLVNVYMNEFDQFMKHKMKAHRYIRYADDFVIFSAGKKSLEEIIPKIRAFLDERLKLALHPTKISIRTLASGVDFLGWIHFLDHRVIRTSTKQRMIRNLAQEKNPASAQSYKGMLGHGNAYLLSTEHL